jgi:hypothetical protein
LVIPLWCRRSVDPVVVTASKFELKRLYHPISTNPERFAAVVKELVVSVEITDSPKVLIDMESNLIVGIGIVFVAPQTAQPKGG